MSAIKKGNNWSPYLAGAALGLVLLAAFVIIGRGLGASSAYSLISAVALDHLDPGYAGGLEYFAPYTHSPSPFRDWIFIEICGVFAGALTGALVSRNFRLQFDRPKGMGRFARFFSALTGGLIIGFASRLARGCTSGVALSGGAQLAVAGWIFVAAMFISGFLFAALLRKLWS